MDKILGNISLKIKIMLILLVPLISLIYYELTSINNSYSQYKESKQLSLLINLTKKITKLTHLISKERFYVSRYVDSKGELFKNDYFKEVDNVNQQFLQIENYVKTIDLPANITKSLMKKGIKTKILFLKVREQLNKNNIKSLKTTNILNFYTKTINDLLEIILFISKFSNDANERSLIITFYTLLSANNDLNLITAYSIHLLKELENITDDFDNKTNISYSQLRLKAIIDSNNFKTNTFLKLLKDKNYKYYNNKQKKLKIDNYTDYLRALSSDDDLELYEGESKLFLKLSKDKLIFTENFIRYMLNELNINIQHLSKNSKNSLIYNSLFSIIIIFSILFLSFLINKKIQKDINHLKTNIIKFFEFLKSEKDTELIDSKGKDEFAVLINLINKEVLKAKDIFQKDNDVLLEISQVMKKVDTGFFTYLIHETAGSKKVESLKNTINMMIKETRNKINKLREILDAYGRYEYDFRLSKEDSALMAGDIGTLNSSLIALGDDISMFMATFFNTNDKLNSSTNDLINISNNIYDSAKIQNESLDKTTLDVKDITENINTNTKNISNMSNISNELNTTAKKGINLANNTASSMENINEKVNQINDSITQIDQIAFQTNILSLNAAVEAATAGEAGKGFAVVAQEVRNLASRSAQVANTIKDLVLEASNKAVEGRKISSDMIQGYNLLNEKIDQTKQIIDTVTKASNVQKEKMININDSIININNMTNKNSNSVNSLNDISAQIQNLSKDIEFTISRASIDEQIKQMNCSAELSTLVSKYKRDHIQFKANNFDKLDQFKAFEVVDCKSCKLGKWIIEMENDSRAVFTNLKTWDELKDSHEQVHKRVQAYINHNANIKKRDFLKDDAINIEYATQDVFNKLNEILKCNCKV